MRFKDWIIEENEDIRVCMYCHRQLINKNDPVGKPLYPPEIGPFQVAKYAKEHGLPKMSHGICKECVSKLY